MKHLKYLLLIPVVLILTDTAASAQIDSLAMAKRRARPKPIKKEFSVGFRVNTDGWGIFVDRGAVKDPGRNTDYFYDTKLFQIEFSEKKHPQETKRTNITGAATENVKPFIFGKINNFYTLKFGYGRRKMIAGKPDPGSVSIHWVYMGGISLGLEKPYYYEAYYSKAGGPLTRETVRYTDSTKVILSPNIDSAAIVGSAGFTKGIGELKIVPGVHFKTGLHFDFAATKTTKLAIETGVSAEFYTRAIELMANQNHVPYFVNAYVSIQAGKRWADKKRSSRR